jgi:hypothetical protein
MTGALRSGVSAWSSSPCYTMQSSESLRSGPCGRARSAFSLRSIQHGSGGGSTIRVVWWRRGMRDLKKFFDVTADEITDRGDRGRFVSSVILRSPADLRAHFGIWRSRAASNRRLHAAMTIGQKRRRADQLCSLRSRRAIGVEFVTFLETVPLTTPDALVQVIANRGRPAGTKRRFTCVR